MNMQRCLIPATALLALGALLAVPALAQTQSGQREAPAFTPVTAERLLTRRTRPTTG